MIVPPKTFDELMNSAISRLSSNTSITNFSPGSVARALLEVVNEHLAQFYQTLDFNLAMAFVSKAQGYFLDLLGELLNCQRRPDESDDNYRYRITHQVEVVAGCNLTALRLELLSLSGVRDVIFHPYTLGTGSFSVYPVPVEAGPVSDVLLEEVQRVLDEKEAYGVRGISVQPTMRPVDIKVHLIFDNGATNINYAVQSARRAVWDYIANLEPGGTLVITELIQRVMDVSDDIRDMEIYYFYVDDRPALVVNQDSAWDEVFYPRLVEIS